MATTALSVAGSQGSTEMKFVVVLINAVVLMRNRLIQGAIFKPQAVALSAIQYRGVAGGNQAVGAAGRATLVSYSGHLVLSMEFSGG
ncbi:MAG: hypothetical protein HLUCCX14_07890 [Marinobacter excellens HL-55]|uniref:Uncharacterized protein n=1 Tax=Marinobacter excellens HL-55 TaxID=1305731 RepID=A0A0P7Z3R8_9GAMM|nr:MAG: hypothetical protein HLUCCX14_07890 [Marinobacter excellens HL-55]